MILRWFEGPRLEMLKWWRTDRQTNRISTCRLDPSGGRVKIERKTTENYSKPWILSLGTGLLIPRVHIHIFSAVHILAPSSCQFYFPLHIRISAFTLKIDLAVHREMSFQLFTFKIYFSFSKFISAVHIEKGVATSSPATALNSVSG